MIRAAATYPAYAPSGANYLLVVYLAADAKVSPRVRRVRARHYWPVL